MTVASLLPVNDGSPAMRNGQGHPAATSLVDYLLRVHQGEGYVLGGCPRSKTLHIVHAPGNV